MPYFHGTRRAQLASILRHGLGGVDTGANAEECVRGVYLASDPRICVAVLLGQFLALVDETTSPRQEVESFVVIVVDDARIDLRKLKADPQVQAWTGSWLYHGVIDVTNAMVIDVDEVYAGWKFEPHEVGWV
jgi:hypothetical protein